MTATRFLTVFLLATFCVWSTVASLNAIVDPYGIIWGPANTWPYERVIAPAFPYVAKPTLAERADADTVLFGSSRVAFGFNPMRPGWPAALGRSFDYGLLGATTSVWKVYLDAILASPNRPRLIIVGMDFFFDDLGSRDKTEQPPRFVQALAGGCGPLTCWFSEMQDIFSMLTSTSTLDDTVRTFKQHKQKAGSGFNAVGYNTQKKIQCTPTCDGKPTIEVFAKRISDYYDLYAHRSDPPVPLDQNRNLAALQEILADCRKQNIRVDVILYPYHATLLSMVMQAKLWPEFEDWKRRVSAIVADQGGSNAELWDFSTVNVYTTEAIPPASEPHRPTKYYYEASHFQPVLGDLIANCLAGEQNQCFGDRLTPKTLDDALLRQRAAYVKWAAANPDMTKLVADAISRSHP